MTKESFFDGWYLTCQEQKSWWWRHCDKARRGTLRPKPKTLDNDDLVAWLSRFSDNLESGHSAGPDQTRPERASLTRSSSQQSADPSASAGPRRRISFVLKGHRLNLFFCVRSDDCIEMAYLVSAWLERIDHLCKRIRDILAALPPPAVRVGQVSRLSRVLESTENPI